MKNLEEKSILYHTFRVCNILISQFLCGELHTHVLIRAYYLFLNSNGILVTIWKYFCIEIVIVVVCLHATH